MIFLRNPVRLGEAKHSTVNCLGEKLFLSFAVLALSLQYLLADVCGTERLWLVTDIQQRWSLIIANFSAVLIRCWRDRHSEALQVPNQTAMHFARVPSMAPE